MMTRPKLRAPRSYSVGGAFSTSAWAIAPNCVCAPVAVTSAWPTPLTIGGTGEQLAVRAVADVFLHRQRLAGQRRLVDAERDCRLQGCISWQQVAGPKLEQIAGHDLAHRHFRELSVAPHAGGQGHKALESARRLLGVEALEEVEGDAQQNDGDDDGCVERLADDARRRR